MRCASLQPRRAAASVALLSGWDPVGGYPHEGEPLPDVGEVAGRRELCGAAQQRQRLLETPLPLVHVSAEEGRSAQDPDATGALADRARLAGLGQCLAPVLGCPGKLTEVKVNIGDPDEHVDPVHRGTGQRLLGFADSTAEITLDKPEFGGEQADPPVTAGRRPITSSACCQSPSISRARPSRGPSSRMSAYGRTF